MINAKKLFKKTTAKTVAAVMVATSSVLAFSPIKVLAGDPPASASAASASSSSLSAPIPSEIGSIVKLQSNMVIFELSKCIESEREFRVDDLFHVSFGNPFKTKVSNLSKVTIDVFSKLAEELLNKVPQGYQQPLAMLTYLDSRYEKYSVAISRSVLEKFLRLSTAEKYAYLTYIERRSDLEPGGKKKYMPDILEADFAASSSTRLNFWVSDFRKLSMDAISKIFQVLKDDSSSSSRATNGRTVFWFSEYDRDGKVVSFPFPRYKLIEYLNTVDKNGNPHLVKQSDILAFCQEYIKSCYEWSSPTSTSICFTINKDKKVTGKCGVQGETHDIKPFEKTKNVSMILSILKSGPAEKFNFLSDTSTFALKLIGGKNQKGETFTAIVSPSEVKKLSSLSTQDKINFFTYVDNLIKSSN